MHNNAGWCTRFKAPRDLDPLLVSALENASSGDVSGLPSDNMGDILIESQEKLRIPKRPPRK